MSPPTEKSTLEQIAQRMVGVIAAEMSMPITRMLRQLEQMKSTKPQQLLALRAMHAAAQEVERALAETIKDQEAKL